MQTRKTTQRTLLAQHLQKRKINGIISTSEKVAGGDLKDGTYKLEEKKKKGYRAVFEMTVKTAKSLNLNMTTSMLTASLKQKTLSMKKA